MEKVTFGILSTATINSYGFMPFRDEIPALELLAVASRSEAGARDYAAQYDVDRYYGSYDELLADPDIACIYNPLPASMHCEWTIKALEAGKHVLCEKPFAMNASEAREMVETARDKGLVLAEAFHNRYHPLMQRALDAITEGEIGTVRTIHANFSNLLTNFKAIQYKKELGGGVLRDMGCYPATFARWAAAAAGEEDYEVTKATAVKIPGGVDLRTKATIEFGPIKAHISCFMLGPVSEIATVTGDAGVLNFVQYIHPVNEILGRRLPTYLLTIINKNGPQNIRIESSITYRHQLETFCESVTEGTTPITGGDEPIKNMKLIDDIAAKAGL